MIHLGLQVGAQTETELKEKKLRVEDALNATKVMPPSGASAIKFRDLRTCVISLGEPSGALQYCTDFTFTPNSICNHFLLIDCSLCGQAAVEEGIVVGGGCTLLRLASKVDAIKETLENDEQKVWKRQMRFSFQKF